MTKGTTSIFAIINFPHIDSNIPITPVYGVYISQCMLCARACSLYSEFLQLHRILNAKLLNQGFLKNRLILSFKMLLEDINTSLKIILSAIYR